MNTGGADSKSQNQMGYKMQPKQKTMRNTQFTNYNGFVGGGSGSNLFVGNGLQQKEPQSQLIKTMWQHMNDTLGGGYTGSEA